MNEIRLTDRYGNPFVVRADPDPYWHERKPEPVVIIDGAADLPLLLDPEMAHRMGVELIKLSWAARKEAKQHTERKEREQTA